MNKIKIVCLIIILELFALINLFALTEDFKIKFIDEKNITINVFDKYIDKGIKACYGNILSCKKVGIKVSSNLNANKIGEYKITYEISNDKEKKYIVKKIKVIDNIKPVIEAPDTVDVCRNGHILNKECKAYDNYDGDITKYMKSTLKENKILFEAIDSSSNKEEIESNVNLIEDTEAPSIELLGDRIIYIKKGEGYKEPGYKTSDNCSDNLDDSVKVDSNLDINKVGIYTITYTLVDDSNNKTIDTRLVRVYSKNVNEEITPTGKTIYLTFDDGPSVYTGRLLDILKEYNVKATFFVTGNGYNSYITRAYREGHTVALHTYTHNYETIYSSVSAYFYDLELIRSRVKNLTGYDSSIIRFPGGASNTVSRMYSRGIMSTLANEVTEKGYKYVDWNVYSGDVETSNTSRIISNVINSLGNGSTYVVLQHDTKEASVNAVRSIIEYGLAHGYNFAPITETTPNIHHAINN